MNHEPEGDLPIWAAPLAVIVVAAVLLGIVNFWPGYHREHALPSPDGTWVAEWTRKDVRKNAPFRVQVVEQGGPDHLKDFRMIVEASCPQVSKDSCRLHWTEDSKSILVRCGASRVLLDLPTGRVKSAGCQKVQTLSLVGMRGDDTPLLPLDLEGKVFLPPLPQALAPTP